MPDWILAPICVVVLVGFIGYAFRQGTKVTPESQHQQLRSKLPWLGWKFGRWRIGRRRSFFLTDVTNPATQKPA